MSMEQDDVDYSPPSKRSCVSEGDDGSSSGWSVSSSDDEVEETDASRESTMPKRRKVAGELEQEEDATYELGQETDEYEDPESELFDVEEDEEEEAHENSNFMDISDGEPDDIPNCMLPKAAAKTLCARNRDFDDDDHNAKMLDYRLDMKMKLRCETKPLWITPQGALIADAFSPTFRSCTQFVLAVAEPISRCEIVHHYQLTSYSLYAAVSVGLDTEEILRTMNSFSKNEIPLRVEHFIRDCTRSYGKIKLVLRGGLYFIESEYRDIMNSLVGDGVIKQCLDFEKNPDQVFEETEKKSNVAGGAGGDDELNIEAILDENEDEMAAEARRVRFLIKQDKIELVQKRVLELDYPLLSEYEFKNDKTLEDINIDLRARSILREYQREGLSKMLSGSRARSGIIVLPCGAGKTLVGVASACTIKKRCMVLCNSGVSVEQWRDQFLNWTSISDSKVCRFTSEAKENAIGASVLISTYSMIAHSQKRSYEAQRVMEWINSVEWGLLLLDEVHTIPAKMFRRVLMIIRAHCKLGLTATLLREDDKIQDLNFLIGPKLYEANWMDLQKQGFLARVICAEVVCPMDVRFYAEFLNTSRARVRNALAVMNPNKFVTCEYLVKYHEQMNDKIIVFSDSVFALQYFAKKLGKPYIHGPMGQAERLRVLSNFIHNPNIKTIFVSKVADTSFDLPDANVLIQISSQAGSRRQEAQRLGRILRPKSGSSPNDFNAFFYSLVSLDTPEVYFSAKRQSFLVNQGYIYKNISTKEILNACEGKFESILNDAERKRILHETLNLTLDTETGQIGDGKKGAINSKQRRRFQRKRAGGLGGLSGAAAANLSNTKNKARHPLFKKFRQ